jgi:ketosteroid isomerase-like protein
VYESDFVHLVTFKDGKVARFQEFFDTYLAGEAFRR